MKLISFGILMQLLRDRDLFLSEIEQNKKLDSRLFLYCFIARYSLQFMAQLLAHLMAACRFYLQLLSYQLCIY